MEKLLYNVSQILGTTLIHSLWQGLLIYTLLRLIFLAVLGLSSQRKHNLAMLALFSMVAWFGYTFYTEFNAYDWTPAVSNYQLSDNISLALYNTYVAATPVHQTTFAAYKAEFFSAIKTYLPYITAIYTIGLLFNLGRLGLAWNQIRVIKQNMVGNLSLQQKVNTLSKKLGIRKPVQLSFSERVDGPCVISFVKPILLLPVTITTQLSADEVEAILIHELSHIQSNDYLLNVLQQLITVLLFFNPFAILISRIISTERENRCDDIVVTTTGDPLIYAQALLKLEETRQTNLTLALAATGKKYHLLTRIERIMKTKKPTGNFKHLILAMVILAGSLGSISWLNPEIESGKIVLKRTAAKVLNTANEVITETTTTTKAPSKKKAHLTIVADDTARLAQLIDTTKKVKKGSVKIVYEDADGNKKEYTSINDLPADARKEFLSANDIYKNSKLNIYSDRIVDMANNVTLRFNSDKNLNLNRAMSSELRNEVKREIAKARELTKSETKKLQKQTTELRKFYTSPDFKNRVKSLEKGAADLNKMYDSPEWKNRIENLAKKSADFANKSNKINSEDWAKSVDELTKQSMKFSQEFMNSPEWKKYQDAILKQALDNAKMQQKSADKNANKGAKKIPAEQLKQFMNGEPGYEGFDWYKYIYKTKEAEEKANAEDVRNKANQIRNSLKASQQVIEEQVQEAIRKEAEEENKKAQDKSKAEKPERPEQP